MSWNSLKTLGARVNNNLKELGQPSVLAAQQVLEESRERYADLYDFAPFGYLTLDFNGCMRDVNLVGARLLGLQRRVLINQPLLPLIQRSDRAKFLEYLSRLRRGKSPLTTELGLPTRQGPPLIVQLISIAKRPALGPRLEFRTAMLDITERRHTEEALRQSNQMLEALVRASPLAVVVVDRNFHVRLWNPAAERLFGWSEAEVRGQRLPTVPRHQQPQFRSLVSIELAGESLTGVEVIRQRKDGSLFDVSVSTAPLRDAQGKLTSFLRIYEDITLRKHAEQELRLAHETLEQRVAERTTELAQSNDQLRREISERQLAEVGRRESENRLHSILEHSPAIIFLKDTFGRYLHCNRQFEQIFHLPLAQTVGKTDAELFPPAQAEAFRANDVAVIRTGLPMQFDELAQYDDGLHTSLVSKFPLFDVNGRVYGIAGIVTDITERKRLEAEVLDIIELERQRIGQDLHDGLCQLLAGIRWKNQSLQEDMASGDPAASQRIGKITALLSQAIEQARAVAHGLQPVEKNPEGLMQALRQLAALTRDLFGIDCACLIPRPIPVEDYGVATDLFRIAQEAVHNAIRHGKASRVELKLLKNKRHLVLKIANDGKAFPDRPRPSGVGLKTMNYRTMRIGATLNIGPGPGRGTIVRCTLPLSKASSNGETTLGPERRDPARRGAGSGSRRAGARRSAPMDGDPARKTK